jgi:hypothetical protein
VPNGLGGNVYKELRGSVVAEARVEKEAADRVQATAADPKHEYKVPRDYLAAGVLRSLLGLHCLRPTARTASVRFWASPFLREH